MPLLSRRLPSEPAPENNRGEEQNCEQTGFPGDGLSPQPDKTATVEELFPKRGRVERRALGRPHGCKPRPALGAPRRTDARAGPGGRSSPPGLHRLRPQARVCVPARSSQPGQIEGFGQPPASRFRPAPRPYKGKVLLLQRAQARANQTEESRANNTGRTKKSASRKSSTGSRRGSRMGSHVTSFPPRPLDFARFSSERMFVSGSCFKTLRPALEVKAGRFKLDAFVRHGLHGRYEGSTGTRRGIAMQGVGHKQSSFTFSTAMAAASNLLQAEPRATAKYSYKVRFTLVKQPG